MQPLQLRRMYGITVLIAINYYVICDQYSYYLQLIIILIVIDCHINHD